MFILNPPVTAEEVLENDGMTIAENKDFKTVSEFASSPQKVFQTAYNRHYVCSFNGVMAAIIFQEQLPLFLKGRCLLLQFPSIIVKKCMIIFPFC